MKKLIVLAIAGLFISTSGYCDVFGDRTEKKMSAAYGANASAGYVDPGTILDYIAAISGYLGVREGFFYDIDNEEFVNYLAATLYTIPDTGIAINIGAVDTDGVIASVDYNIGAVIPADDVPLLSLVEYLYVGFGAGYRSHDEDWNLVYGPTVSFKATF